MKGDEVESKRLVDRPRARHPMSLWDPDFLEDKTGIKPIRRQSRAPCPKATCIEVKPKGNGPGRRGCHNYDKKASLGYTCLIKGNTPREPDRPKSCCWYIAGGQSTLVF